VKPSVCLLTAYNSTLQPLAAFTVPRMQALAQAHGYEVRAIHRDDWERPRGWIKIEAIHAALDSDFDFLFWIDVDAIILRSDVDVRTAAVDHADLHMVWHGPDTARIEAENFVPHFNSGVMLIRVTDWSRHFFSRVWEVGQLSHHWFDQPTILHLLGYDSCIGFGPDRPDEPNRSRLARLDAAWNSIPGVATAPEAIIHHYAGAGHAPTILRLFEAEVRTAPLREGASTELRQAFADQFSLWREDATMRHWVTAERNSALARMEAAAAERDAARAEVLALRNSNSWKLTAPLRRAAELFRRQRSRN
jgi:galactosyl transferase GMA12/MNN10 family